MPAKKPKIIVVLGPTGSGKSALAVRLAKKHHGEVISADSRQVYKGLNIGTGKITKKEMRGVPHHLLSIYSPKKQYTAAAFVKDATKLLRCIVIKGKTPIICGGTGFYISALLGETNLSSVPPNKKLRQKLSVKSATELFKILKQLDPKRAEVIDGKNPVRLIRAIEIAKSPRVASPYSPPLGHPMSKWGDFQIVKIGIKFTNDELKKRIKIRLLERLKNGMITEARKLHEEGLSYKRMEELGLEYRYLAKYLKKEISKEELVQKLNTEIWRYAKRQRTWFKRYKEIRWFEPKNIKIEKIVKNFVKKERPAKSAHSS